jgi:hypothetical protein
VRSRLRCYLGEVKGVQQVGGQVFSFFFVFVVVFGFGVDGAVTAEVEADPNLVDLAGQSVLTVGLGDGNRLRSGFFAPAFVFGFGLLGGCGFDGLDCGLGVVDVHVVIGRFSVDWRRGDIDIVLFFHAGQFFIGFVLVSDLIESFRHLHDEHHAIIVQHFHRDLRGDFARNVEFWQSYQLFDGHHVDFEVIVLPTEDFLLVSCLLREVSQELILVGVSCFEPAHQEAIFAAAFVYVREHLCFAFVFVDSQLGETWIHKFHDLSVFFLSEDVYRKFDFPQTTGLDLSFTCLQLKDRSFRVNNFFLKAFFLLRIVSQGRIGYSRVARFLFANIFLLVDVILVLDVLRQLWLGF